MSVVAGEVFGAIGRPQTEVEAGRRMTTVVTVIPEAAAKKAAGAANETNETVATGIQTRIFDATLVTSVTAAIAI